MNKNEKPDKAKEPSEEYQNFENLLRHVASVPKEDVDRSMNAEKEAKQKQKRTHSE